MTEPQVGHFAAEERSMLVGSSGIGPLFQFAGDLFAERRRFFDGTFGFGAANAIDKRNRTHADLIIDDLRIRRDGALTTAAHPAKKGTLGCHALERVKVVESFTDLDDAFIIGTDL